MIKSQHSLILSIAVSSILVLATSGCATKKYVRNQVSPVSHQVATLETKTNANFASVKAKHNSDISQVNERISTTDQRVAQVANETRQAQGTADRAMEETTANAGKISSNSAAIDTLATGVAKSINFQLVEKADVNFKFNQATLTPEAQSELNEIAAKVQALPRSVVELAGFTDPRGSKNYNLALSRRRAEAVQRYLVMQKVPLRSIHIVGLGEEAPPENLEATVTPLNPNPSKAESDRLARRVHINVFGADNITEGSASRERQ
jgi:OmpA-OmpF porin, OOP family